MTSMTQTTTVQYPSNNHILYDSWMREGIGMAKFTMNIDETLKRQASELYEELGMTLTTAITVFLKQSVREGRMPFQPSMTKNATDDVGPARMRDRETLLKEVERLRSLSPEDTELNDFDWNAFRKEDGRREH